MFSQSWRRFPLRRCLHTSVSSPHTRLFNTRLAFALGASAATASYLTYRLTFDHRIALDSVSSAPKKPHPSSETSHATIPPPTPKSEPSSESSPTSEQPAEDDASAQGASGGAYNPVTGEINWDCPCLGGMAYGPCGPEFREAFSCFIYSEDEPKGINCVEKFQAMQTCFRAHPEVYADEIMDDEEDTQTPSTSPTEEKKFEEGADVSVSPSSPVQKTPEVSSS